MTSVRLDFDSQPPAPINAARRAERAIHEMLGMCKLILLDGVVTPEEATYLNDWIEANPEVTSDFAGAALARRLMKIFSDGRVDPEEQEDLADLLRMMVGGQVSVMGGENVATSLPLDTPPPPLTFAEQVYVLTGKFAFGPRNVCEEVVVSLGGRCESGVTKRTNVIVIGSFGSRDWAHTSHGRKIQKAVEYREAGRPLVIVSEDHWAAALP